MHASLSEMVETYPLLYTLATRSILNINQQLPLCAYLKGESVASNGLLLTEKDRFRFGSFETLLHKKNETCVDLRGPAWNY